MTEINGQFKVRQLKFALTLKLDLSLIASIKFMNWYPLLVIALLCILLQSCGVNKNAELYRVQTSLSDQEIIKLSEDCEYVRKQMKVGLKKWKEPKVKKISDRAERKEYFRKMTIKHGHHWAKENKQRRKTEPKQKLNVKKYKESEKDILFRKNDYLVSLLEHSQCFIGQSKAQILELFGKPYSQCTDEMCLQKYLQYAFKIEGNDYYGVKFIFEESKLLKITKNKFSIITISCPTAESY